MEFVSFVNFHTCIVNHTYFDIRSNLGSHSNTHTHTYLLLRSNSTSHFVQSRYDIIINKVKLDDVIASRMPDRFPECYGNHNSTTFDLSSL